MTDPLGLIGGSGSIQPPGALNRGAAPGNTPAATDFKKLLMENIEQVNGLQQDAEKAIEDLAAGRRDDLANVMIAKQKADTAFKMLQQVRNKLINAYEDVKQMRV